MFKCVESLLFHFLLRRQYKKCTVMRYMRLKELYLNLKYKMYIFSKNISQSLRSHELPVRRADIISKLESGTQ